MSYCPQCGTYIPEGENVCPNCQTVIGAAPQPQYQQVPPQQPQYQQVPPQQPQYQQMPMNNPVKDISTAKVLGIVAIVFGFFRPLVSWICGGIGISKANKAIDYARSVGDMMLLQEAESAKKFNKIGVIIGIVVEVLSIGALVAFMIIGASAGVAANY